MLITPKLSEIQKIGPYLDNFVTNPYTFLVYSGDSDPESPEYAKICMGLVRKLSRYGRILKYLMRMIVRLSNLQKWPQNGKYS